MNRHPMESVWSEEKVDDRGRVFRDYYFYVNEVHPHIYNVFLSNKKLTFNFDYLYLYIV